ncbi:helix-turn-helix domain-containing protein [Limosilactobacillus equigenerosi]|uniref:Helix-turn-helix domain-containing protein n=2 Tax=Limosilactobacillus TaxID=2742598 RepID=A0A0R1UWF3_9LACO|nr:helix-turn-helix domain-containing protein [Limosilactobacillus equigenerosi]KRL95189.1 hypothetical protein FC21_GL000776 [Limosilactobacillus equigenerosi DSM 18793 = JCM 14505]
MENEKPSYYSILTADVRYDKRLGKPNPRELFSEITALSNKDGYCHASNSYFARIYEVSTVTISRWVSLLEKCGYLQREIIYREGTNEIKERRLYPISTPINRKVNTPYQTSNGGISKSDKTPIIRNVKENNTSINNTSINKTTTTNLYIGRMKDKDMIQYLNSVDDELVEWITSETEKAPQPSQRYFESIVKRLMSINAMTVQDATKQDENPIPKIELIKLAD